MAAREGLFTKYAAAVTGGGAGLGRQYCIDLANEGAGVIVAGRGENVHTVATELRAAGGIAESCIADACHGEAIIGATLRHFGRIDGLIVNAGIVRDQRFDAMTQNDWDDVMAVHLDGAYACAKAAWPHMVAQGGGSIVFTASGAGLHGNFGQANYAAAKGGIIAFMRSLAIEGEAHGVRVNAIAPMAATAMTARVFSDALARTLPPASVSPFVLALLHPDCRETGAVIEAGGGWAGKLRWERSAGHRFAQSRDMLADVLAGWSKITTFDAGADHPDTTRDSLKAAAGTLIDVTLKTAAKRRT